MSYKNKILYKHLISAIKEMINAPNLQREVWDIIFNINNKNLIFPSKYASSPITRIYLKENFNSLYTDEKGIYAHLFFEESEEHSVFIPFNSLVAFAVGKDFVIHFKNLEEDDLLSDNIVPIDL